MFAPWRSQKSVCKHKDPNTGNSFLEMIMLLHLTRADDVMCFKHTSFFFLVQEKRLEVNVGEI